MKLLSPRTCLLLVLVLVLGQIAFAQEAKGKDPVIIIPGLTGSELVNSRTGEVVWYKTSRSKDDDVRLPMSSRLSMNRDDLVAGDIIGGIKVVKFLPETEIYQQLIDALTDGGYHRASWAKATRADAADSFFVFAYDWRRDNVENARLLIRNITSLKQRLGRPNLKFNIVAHSMGGLISRYAAMYGDADIPAGKPVPTWAGAKHLNKIFLLGTPNEGSLLALDGLLNGVNYIPGGVNLPWVQNLSRFDVFTIPSVFQLLPHSGSVRVYDEDLNPIKLDIYEPATWDEYDWSIWKDKDFNKKFDAAERRNARPYFLAALARAKSFQAALDANTKADIPVRFYLMGAECKDTLDAMVLRQSDKKDRWLTIFKPESYTTSTGTKITADQLKAIMYSKGDSVVPARSLLGSTLIDEGLRYALPVTDNIFQCESHSKLVTNPAIQSQLLDMLTEVRAR